MTIDKLLIDLSEEKYINEEEYHEFKENLKQLSVIPEKIKAQLKNIENISLNHQKLNEMPKNISYFDKLKKLNLSFSEIPNNLEILNKLGFLTEINMKFSKNVTIETLYSLIGCKKLKYLYLTSTNIIEDEFYKNNNIEFLKYFKNKNINIHPFNEYFYLDKNKLKNRYNELLNLEKEKEKEIKNNIKLKNLELKNKKEIEKNNKKLLKVKKKNANKNIEEKQDINFGF